MSKIIIAIKPKYVKSIIEGSKKYELRTRIPKRKIDKLIVYETSPISKITCEVEVISIIKMNIDDLYKKTSKYSQLSKEEFYSYFKNKTICYAYQLGKVTVYKKAKSISDFNLKGPIQSFAYIND